MASPDKIICVGLDHTNSDRSTRLLVKMKDAWAWGTMRRVFHKSNIHQPLVLDAMVLSTCNRVEIYAALPCNISEENQEFVIENIKNHFLDLAWHRISKRESRILSLTPDVELMDRIGLALKDRPAPPCPIEARSRCEHQVNLVKEALTVRIGNEASSHLISTVMTLESAIIGDRKITEQISFAHKQSRSWGGCVGNKTLDKLCRIALKNSRDLAKDRSIEFTSLGSTVGFIAAMHFTDLRPNRYSPHVLILGSSKTIKDAVIHCAFDRSCHFTFCGDITQGKKIATSMNRSHAGREGSFRHNIIDDISKIQTPPDVIICEDDQLSDSKLLELVISRKNWYRDYGVENPEYDLVLFDLSRNLNPSEIDGVFRYTIEKIEHYFGSSLKEGQEIISNAKRLRYKTEREYDRWRKEQNISSEIKQACKEIDQAMSQEITLLEKATSEDQIAKIKKKYALEKHEVVKEIRKKAGLVQKSRNSQIPAAG